MIYSIYYIIIFSKFFFPRIYTTNIDFLSIENDMILQFLRLLKIIYFLKQQANTIVYIWECDVGVWSLNETCFKITFQGNTCILLNIWS